jgi:hypothetical protein
LVTSERLATQANADAAVANGDLSRDQTTIVADAVAADPTAEQGLLDTAQQSSVKNLRAQAAAVKANADSDPAATRERLRRSRSRRTWKDREGAWNLALRHLPEVGAEIEALLEIDHTTGWALTHTTTLDDLGWLCTHHHDQKTHHGHRLTGPPGNRTWIPPPGTRVA